MRLQAKIGWSPVWVQLLIWSLVIPTELSFTIFGLRLNAYRIILLTGFLPALVKCTSNRKIRFGLPDFFILFNGLWCVLALSYNHEILTGLQSGGIRVLELCGSYFIARAYIIDEKTYLSTLKVFITALTFLLPFLLVETFTSINLIKVIANQGTFNPSIDKRFGLTRAFGPFDHPILLGVFGAAFLGMFYNSYGKNFFLSKSRVKPVLLAIICSCCSISSGAILTIAIQAFLICWRKVTKGIAARWRILTILFFITYFAIDLLSNRGPLYVFMSYMTFSPQTAYYRKLIFDSGIENVIDNPVFGIGLNDWSRPEWMISASMDNFWLVQAVTFGLPSLITILLATIIPLGRKWGADQSKNQLRMGWTLSLVGIAISGITVHFWNALLVFFGLLLGMGVWMTHPTLNSVRDEYSHERK